MNNCIRKSGGVSSIFRKINENRLQKTVEKLFFSGNTLGVMRSNKSLFGYYSTKKVGRNNEAIDLCFMECQWHPCSS